MKNKAAEEENKLRARQCSFYKLLTQFDTWYSIPNYQRHYKWKSTEQVDQLLMDINNFYEEENGNSSYFLGTLILKEETTKNDLSEYTIVDGQQRLTTYLLILKAFQLLYIKNSYSSPNIFREIESQIYVNSSNDMDEGIDIHFDQFSFKLKNHYSSDLENIFNFKNKMELLEYKKKHNKNELYYENILHIFEFLDKKIKNNRHWNDWYYIIAKNLKLVRIIIGKNVNPLMMFENINSKGLSLSLLDLIKNYMYISIENVRTNFSNNDLIMNDLLSMEKKITIFFETDIIKLNEDPTKDNSFIRIYAKLYHSGRLTSESKDIYINWKKDLIESKIMPPHHKLITIENIKKLFESLTTALSFYNYYKGWENFDKLQKNIDWRINSIVSSSFSSYSLILYQIYLDFFHENDDKNLIKKGQETLEFIDSWRIRRKIVISTTEKDMNTFSNQIINKLEKNEKLTATKLKTILHEIVTPDKNSKYIIPSDVSVRKELKNMNAFEGKKTLTRELLVRMDQYNNPNSTITVKNLRNKTITLEHILPQKWWNVLNWQHWNEEKAIELINNIGNLTLLHSYDNSKASNNDFITKKKLCILSSGFKINDYFQDINEWTPEQVYERQEYLISQILEIFPI